MTPVALAAAVVVLVVAGHGDLAPPTSLDAIGPWVEERGAVTATLAVVRLVALGVALWLAVASVVATGARLLGAVRLAAIAERALPTLLRRAVAGAGLASVVALGQPVAAQPYDEGTATMSVLPDGRDPAPAPAPPPDPAPVPDPAPAPAVDEWVVAPGESFWSIAEEVVADAIGRPPSVGEVDGYWRALVDANRDRLTSPSPDLVRPGQVFVLPPVSPAA